MIYLAGTEAVLSIEIILKIFDSFHNLSLILYDNYINFQVNSLRIFKYTKLNEYLAFFLHFSNEISLRQSDAN